MKRQVRERGGKRGLERWMVEALGRQGSHAHLVWLGANCLNSLGFCSLVYKMRSLDRIISAKVRFLVSSSIKCV